MAEQDDKQREIDRLTKQIREGSNTDALKAVDELRERGWLTDGSLQNADLVGANLYDSDLSFAELEFADLTNANLVKAYAPSANLADAKLANANLTMADLFNAKLDRTVLAGANLVGTDLNSTHFFRTYLYYADFTNAVCFRTRFLQVDLSHVNGLKEIVHKGPSQIDIDSLYESRGLIPEQFLRGCGVPKEFIEFTTGLFDEQSIQFQKCFISYSHKDLIFAEKLHKKLDDRGVNSWIDFDKLKGGDFWADVINQAIHYHEKLIVCCSENSLHSLGVDREVNTALRIEERIYQQSKEKVSIIIPVDVDGYIEDCDNHVARRLQERHIINAQNWQSNFETVLNDIIKALRTDEGRETPPEPKL